MDRTYVLYKSKEVYENGAPEKESQTGLSLPGGVHPVETGQVVVLLASQNGAHLMEEVRSEVHPINPDSVYLYIWSI